MTICLVKFAEHFENKFADQIKDVHFWKNRLNEDVERLKDYDRSVSDSVRMFREIYYKVSREAGEPEVQAFNSAFSRIIELWANGATDHLYDMKVPEEWEDTIIAEKVAELKSLGLSIGHGFTGRIWTFEDFLKLFRLTHEIALEVDRRIGIHDVEEGEH